MSDQPYQLLPPLSAEEYAALRDDIAANGVLVPVVRDQHGNILDGHHRQQIADELGVTYRVDVVQVGDENHARSLARTYNLARRHLNREQKRRLIADEIESDPNRSDREIARLMGCDHKTVGSIRRELSGEFPHPETAPKLTRQEAEEFTNYILMKTAEFDMKILVDLLRGIPKTMILGTITEVQHQFELEHHGDEELVGPVRRTFFEPRIADVIAWPHGGWYAEECTQHPDELAAFHRSALYAASIASKDPGYARVADAFLGGAP